MLKLPLIVTLLLFSIYVNGQQVSYRVLEDNPDQAFTKFVAPEFGMENNATDLGVFLGVSTRRRLTGSMVLEAVGRFDLFSSNSSGATYLLEGGIFLPLKSKIKNKEVPIILSYDPYAGTAYNNGQRYNVEETKFLTIPSGQYKNEYGLRGGIHHRVIGVEDDINGIAPGNISLAGVYLGGQMTTKAHVRTKINDDVERYGAGFTRIYFDFLILPVSNLSAEALAPAAKSDGAIGWRIGYQWYVSPHEGSYKFLGNSVFGAELGSRPLSGFLFNITWGFALNRSK